MTRTSVAALLLLAIPALSFANPPRQCYPYAPGGGFGLGLFSKIHQHGPLFNYGPYYGYPPFEPYGPWNAYLQYNPWYYGQGGGRCHGHHWHRDRGCHGCGQHAHWLHGGWFRGHNNLSCGQHCGHHWGLCRKAKSCNPCASACAATPACGTPPAPAATPTAPAPKDVKPVAYDPTDDPAARYSGFGTVEAGAVFYSGLPTLNPAVVNAGY